MKCVILAGGMGTRLAEETSVRPKPMVEIGGRPILWHIMKIFSAHGVSEFVVCLGYKGYVIKEYFANYFLHMSDVTFDMRTNRMEVHGSKSEPWRVTLVDTGERTNTGGRLKRIAAHLADQPMFLMTYGDCLGNVDVTAELAFHRRHGRLATLTAVLPPGRYGALRLEGSLVRGFTEKPRGDGAAVNGGFFVLDRRVLDRIDGDQTSFESEVLPGLAAAGELEAFLHDGFWHPMDTLRDKLTLEGLWQSGRAPWAIWS